MKYNHPAEIPMSKDLAFEWIGERIVPIDENMKGDTHPLTWADDDNIYAGTGDPCWMMKDGRPYRHHPELGGWGESKETYQNMSGQVVEKFTGDPNKTGSFAVERVHDMPGYTGPGGSGPKPCGMICVDGKLYYAVQNLLGYKKPPNRAKSQHGSDATILCSADYGKTWTPELNQLLAEFVAEQYIPGKPVDGSDWKTTEEERAGYKGWKPMFPGSKFGGLSFVQFGKNNADALDSYVYAISGDQWDNGKNLMLGRVLNDKIMDRDSWEFAAIDYTDLGCNILWHKNIDDAKPVLEIEGHISLPEMVYIKSIKKYILLTWGLHTDFRTPTGSELTILESDNIYGPFSLVHYDWMWYKRECCAYTPRIPLKWFDYESLEGYILHSGNWETQEPYYRPQMRRFRFMQIK